MTDILNNSGDSKEVAVLFYNDSGSFNIMHFTNFTLYYTYWLNSSLGLDMSIRHKNPKSPKALMSPLTA